MVSLELISLENALTFKALRLRALRDTPGAFSSTYARESQLTDDDWMERAEQWRGDRSAAFLALDGDVPCGIAGCVIHRDDPSEAHLVSMWVPESHRRAGVGRALVNGIVDWARAKGVARLSLMVTSDNDAAVQFYQRLEFSFTGRTEPYPNDPKLLEREMCKPI